MRKINYQKIFDQLIQEYPHELDKIEKVVRDARDNRQRVNISFSQIIKNRNWNADEKARLLTFFDYDKREQQIEYTDEYHHTREMDDYLYTIKFDVFSGFEALMKIYKNIEYHFDGCCYISKDEAYRRVFNAVINSCKDERKPEYIKAILDNLTNNDIRRLIKPCYEGYRGGEIHDESIFVSIIASQDFDLVKKNIEYVDDINMYLSDAVATGNIEIVKLFLEKGADINYLTAEVILGTLTPLKMAIANNDYEMTKFLIDNGADITLQICDDNFLDRLKNYQIDIYDKYHDIESLKEDSRTSKQLQYIRTSTPLEYATKLREGSGLHGEAGYILRPFETPVCFNGESVKSNNHFIVSMHRVSEQVKNRMEIADLIFEKLEDKTNVNFSDLLGLALMSRDSEKFQKYSDFARKNNYPVDFDLMFRLFFDFVLPVDKNMFIPFLDLIGKYDKNNDKYLYLFDTYIQREVKRFKPARFSIDDFNKELLNRILPEKRKNIFLVPYCRNLESLQHLISLGFDIKQVDSEDRNILYYLLYQLNSSEDLNCKEMELFNYLLENLDLSAKDKDNKTILYYAMQRFNTKDEYLYASKDKVGTRSNLEKAVVRLIENMKKQDVYNDDIQKVLEKRLQTHGRFGDQIAMECVYQHHKELFDALIDKGFVLSKTILGYIFESLYPSDVFKEEREERLLDSIDMDNTLDFLYQRLDYNTQIQEKDIDQEYKKVIHYIEQPNITFEQYVEALKLFNGQIIELKSFYDDNIQKKFNPKKYMEYAKEKTNTTYENLDGYLLPIIIKGINKFGENLVDILDCVPNYDINSYIEDSDVGLSYWGYNARIADIIGFDEDCNPVYGNEYFAAKSVYTHDDQNIVFTGGLMQYAILIDNIPMVQLLRQRGANLKFKIDGEDHTWDYVNSRSMLQYMESVIGKKQYSGFEEEEQDYYSSLFSSTEETTGEEPKRLLLIKDDSQN